MNPSYGYIKGFDRTIYMRMDCNTIITEFIENNHAFSKRSVCMVKLQFNLSFSKINSIDK